MRILIVEDETPIAAGLRFNFEQEGYEVIVAGDGPTALEAVKSAQPPVDLVVLDLMLPGMSGYEICKSIRGFRPRLPILVLSARRHSQDKAHAFDCGADQYVTKPFDLQELLSRVRNLLKRREAEEPLSPRGGEVPDNRASLQTYHFDEVTIDFSKFQVIVGGRSHVLTTMEMQLLRYLVEHEGIVLSRGRILQDVWEQSARITTRSIDNFVMRLRKIIEPDPSDPRHLLSVRGTGYRFVAKPQSASPRDA